MDTLVEESVLVKIFMTDELLAVGVIYRHHPSNVASMTTVFDKYDNSYVFGDRLTPNPLY